MTGRILVTGATGKTGRRLAGLLESRGLDHRLASRGLGFDWNDEATWDRALEDVRAAYLVAPPGDDPAPAVIRLIERAAAHGVTRFVLLSASVIPAGGPGMGQVHLWLSKSAVDWAVLRPSWFMQNFSEGQHLATIRDEDAIYSAAGDGRIPFIDSEDIAAAALGALTAQAAPNIDVILTGPQAITYDEVAKRIGEAIGRSVVHRRITPDELAARDQARGLTPLLSRQLAIMDMALAGGAEDRTTDGVRALSGRPAARFEDFAAANAEVWAPQPAIGAAG